MLERTYIQVCWRERISRSVGENVYPDLLERVYPGLLERTYSRACLRERMAKSAGENVQSGL